MVPVLVSCSGQPPKPSEPTQERHQAVHTQGSQTPIQDHVATQSSGWVWIKAGNNVSTFWDVTTGPAEVTIDGEKFSASLYWADNPTESRISLDGSIKDGKIKATEAVHNTDLGESAFTGTYIKTDYVTTINLSDGFGMIGITHPLKQ